MTLSYQSHQNTIQQEVSETGNGLFTGEKVSITLVPAEENTGIRFERVDLPQTPIIEAKLKFTASPTRCTKLIKNQISIQTVEHLLSAVSAYGIDNLVIKTKGSELPACDGSAKTFVAMIEKAGIRRQNAPKRVCIIEKPITWSKGDIHMIALPAKEFKISYTLHYPHSEFIKSQYFSYVVNPQTYKTEIAPCRTFSLYEEIEPMLKKGLLKSAGLENGVVIRENKILNPEGVRFSNEMVRHKVLDLIGDLSLIGMPILGHIISIRSGHKSNIEFSKKILKEMDGG